MSLSKRTALFFFLFIFGMNGADAQSSLVSPEKIVITNQKAGANSGTTCSDAVELYPSNDCSNSCGGNQYCGEYQCESGDCASSDMTGTGGLDGSCTPDNDAGQVARWISFTATANDITITNETDYSGPGASNIEKKDYVLYSGSCGSLTEIGCAADVVNGSSNTFTGLTVGQTYYIMVTRSQTSINEGCASCNAAATCLTSTVPYSPPNNTCAGATSLSSGVPVNSSTANSTATGPGAVCLSPASGSVENNVWFQWCAPATWTAGDSAYIHIYDQTCNSTSGLQVGVFSANESCGSFSTSVVCGNAGNITDYYYTFVANPGECFFINIDGYAGTGCSFTAQVNDSPVLPIELLEFNAETVKGERVMLNWKTAAEINNDKFIVERTADGKYFEEVAVLDGAGMSNEVLSYSVFDNSPMTGVSHYRLKQVDYDGEYSYSGMVAVEFEAKSDQLEIYPNPIGSKAYINYYSTGPDQDDLTIRIFNHVGQKFVERQFNIHEGVNKLPLNFDGLSSGIYFLKANTNGSSIMEKIVKE